MHKIVEPGLMNQEFAAAFNAGDIERLISFYEPDATHFNGSRQNVDRGVAVIRSGLEELLKVPGRMRSENNVCLVHDDIALIRADWAISDADGRVLLSGSSMEVARRQVDGRWLTVIDHAVGASLARIF